MSTEQDNVEIVWDEIVPYTYEKSGDIEVMMPLNRYAPEHLPAEARAYMRKKYKIQRGDSEPQPIP